MSSKLSLIATVFCLSLPAVSVGRAQAVELFPDKGLFEVPADPGRPLDPLHEAKLISLQQPTPSWHAMITNLPDDWSGFAGRTFQAKSIPAIAGIAVMTGALMASDPVTYRASRTAYQNSPFIQSASNVFVHLGDGKTHLALAAGFALYGFAEDDSRALRTASQTVEVLLASGIFVQVLKHMTGRESPEAATNIHGEWRFFPNLKAYGKHQARYYAYPSGHITTTVATVTVLAENYPEATWIRPVGYTLSGLVGLSLVNVRYHWYSDLPLGVAIGYLFGKIAAHPGRPASGVSSDAGDSQFNVAPQISPYGAGLMMCMLF